MIINLADQRTQQGEQPKTQDQGSTPLASLEERAAAFAHNARSAATEAAYQVDWRDFSRWCEARGIESLPASPETVALYLADGAVRLRVSTLQRRLAAIIVRHRCAGIEFDAKAGILVDVWRGIRRTLGTAKRGKSPMVVEDLKGIVAQLPTTLAGKRDRAVLLLGFAAAMRRSEIVALNLADCLFVSEGLVLRIRRAKGDQEGAGELRAVPRGVHPETCPVRAVKDWLMAARLPEGPLFRGVDRFGTVGRERLEGRAIARIVKRAVSAYGQAQGWTRQRVAEECRRVAGHSLRSGYATSAAKAGAAEWAIMRQTGHKRRDSLQPYIRLGTLFRSAAPSFDL